MQPEQLHTVALCGFSVVVRYCTTGALYLASFEHKLSSVWQSGQPLHSSYGSEIRMAFA